MSGVRLWLFDDARARRWQPFAATRPVGELLLGTRTLRERSERVFRAPCSGHLGAGELVGFDDELARPVLDAGSVDTAGRRVFLSSRAVLADQTVPSSDGSVAYRVAGEVVGWCLPDGAPPPSAGALAEPEAEGPDTDEVVDLDGELLGWPWDLVARNGHWIGADAAQAGAGFGRAGDVIRIGDGKILLGPGAVIEPGVVVDTRSGPVILAEGARVEGPARLTGPLFVGRDSLVFGGAVGSSSIGPVCKVRGELVDSVLNGFVNKAHDGHIGHALLGSWVNLGAGTTNSDLKNNYGPVRVQLGEDDEVDTGLMKVGCFLGEHVKTGIGTMLNTGTVLGAGTNVFGGQMPPKWVPPFSWGSGDDFTPFRLDRCFEVAERAMGRRDRVLTPGVQRILTDLWERTHGGAER